MKGLERNKQEFRYAVPTGKKEPIVDQQGNLTGEYAGGYSEPVSWKGNISAGGGDVEAAPFGSEITYDRVIVLAGENPPIVENCKVWFDDQQYIVKAVAKSLNGVSIAIRKVDVRV